MHLRQRGLLATMLKSARRLPTPAAPCLALADRYLPGAMLTNGREAFANHPACRRHTKAVINRAGKKSRAIVPRCWRGGRAGSSSCFQKWMECSWKVQSSNIHHPSRDREPDQLLLIAQKRLRYMTKGASGYRFRQEP